MPRRWQLFPSKSINFFFFFKLLSFTASMSHVNLRPTSANHQISDHLQCSGPRWPGQICQCFGLKLWDLSMSNRNNDLWDDVNIRIYSWGFYMYIRMYCSYPEQVRTWWVQQKKRFTKSKHNSWNRVKSRTNRFPGLVWDLNHQHFIPLTFLTVTPTFSTPLTWYASMPPTLHIMRSHALNPAASLNQQQITAYPWNALNITQW